MGADPLTRWLERADRRIRKARLLLQPAVAGSSGIWADLGCGDGVFTYLLSTLLAAGSQVYAVDKDRRALQTLTDNLDVFAADVTIHARQADFTHRLSLPGLDGLVMANSLHFVSAKETVLSPLVALLKPGGRLVLVEYNSHHGNYAVPYPLDEASFLELATAVGLRRARIVARVPSTFLGEMYTGLALRAKSDERPARSPAG